jgi:mannose-6-phosphate isomerase-like protein (cupin superfamily)
VPAAHRDRRARELNKEPNVEQASFFPDWRTLVRYAAPRPEPALLVDADGIRLLVAGLEPGGEIPAHPERLAVYHVLEGQGEMTVDDNRFALTPGATVIAGRGSRRGIRSLTRLAFLAVRIGPELESDD